MEAEISHPIRRQIVQRAADGPATLPELAAAAGVHINTARTHVAALQRAGSLSAEPAETAGRGRPPMRYRLADDVTLPTSDLRGLAELLARAVLRAGQAEDELQNLGREWGRRRGRDAESQEPEQVLPPVLESLGFDARLEPGELLLSACPCRLVSPERPELVCNLAFAVVEGMLDGLGSGMRVIVRVHDPEGRRCTAAITQ